MKISKHVECETCETYGTSENLLQYELFLSSKVDLIKIEHVTKKGDRKILAKKTHIFVEVKEKLRHKPVVGSGEVGKSEEVVGRR